ncbi:MAG: hypothetical protein BWY22_01173 [Bacteroidetes bacterium ADurb.Bin217]|nr:MAG: hypothetical protein BWY22_01173 [Bacteroidetes bacterium ADurb.Bin217]
MKDIYKKIQEQFFSLNISHISEPKDQLHLYADYIELVCIISNDYVSQRDIIDRLIDSGVEFKLEKEKLDGEIGQIDSEIYDLEESWIINIFEYLKERAVNFGANYPFIIDSNGIIFSKDKLNDSQYLYVYLLLSSSLNYFKTVKHELTSEFEIISEKALQSYLPNAVVYGFGSNTIFKGNAKEKIKNLAKEINIEVKERILNQISKHNSKEEGLDIVGWLPFKDNNPNTIIIFGQCACGQNWLNKQNETRRYDRFYESYLLPFIHALFVPHDFRNYNGEFGFDKDINNHTLVFERRRILELLDNFTFDNSFDSKLIVDKCIEYVEDIV